MERSGSCIIQYTITPIEAGIDKTVQRRAMGWTAGDRLPAGARFFPSPQCPRRLWGPPSLLSNGYSGFIPRE
jgi:hypothetical protein